MKDILLSPKKDWAGFEKTIFVILSIVSVSGGKKDLPKVWKHL